MSQPNEEQVSFMLRLSVEDADLIRKAVAADKFVHRSEWLRHKIREAAEKSLKKSLDR